MPLYEFECTRCGRREERFVPAEERNSRVYPCPEGHCALMVRRLTPPNVHTETGAKP